MESNQAIIKNAIEFLLFEYFGLTLEDGNDQATIVHKAVELAYDDATNQGAFNALFNDKEIKNGTRKMASVVEKSVKELYESGIAFDDWHKNLCEEICNKYGKICDNNAYPLANSFFSYGNAQKWVNMTIKNLYVISGAYLAVGCKDNKSFFESVASRSDEYHVPLDNIILGELYKQELLGSRKDGPIRKSGRKEPSYYISGEENGTEQKYTWSRIPSQDFYEAFRKKLEDAIHKKEEKPIEWECEDWIERKKRIKELGKDLSKIDD